MTTFINDKRRWDDSIAHFLEQIIREAFPGQDVPDTITYYMRDQPACDAILYDITTDFNVSNGYVRVSFVFLTGEGGLRRIDDPVPPPSIGNVQVTYEDEEGEEHRWDADMNTWSAEKDAE